MVDDLDSVRSEGLGESSQAVQRVDPDAKALTMLVLGEKHDEPLCAADVERIEDVVYLFHSKSIPARGDEERRVAARILAGA